jgi:hypothetical protein
MGLSAASRGAILFGCGAWGLGGYGEFATILDRLAERHASDSGRNGFLFRPIHLLLRPYATSHDALDQDAALHQEVRNAARALITQIALRRAGTLAPDEDLRDPRPK